MVPMLKEPPKALAKPLVPLAAPVLMVNLSAPKPVMLVNVPSVQLVLVVELKLSAGPLVSGPIPESDQRLMLNLVPVVAVMSKAPVVKVS